MKFRFLLIPFLLAANHLFAQGVPVNFYATGAAVGSTGVETAITMTRSSGNNATTSAASFVVGQGKTRYHITEILFATQGNATATAQATIFNLRINTGGAVTTSSTPIILKARSATAGVSGAYDRLIAPVPQGGLEISGDGTLQMGVTVNSVYTTNAPTVDIWICGYEY